MRASASTGPGEGRDRSTTASSQGLTQSKARTVAPPHKNFLFVMDKKRLAQTQVKLFFCEMRSGLKRQANADWEREG
ncbi:MAG TPA: hypothetical protein VJY34_07280 [Roseiarcus sp.]|nr:hypothetical protein [Roseiarcus sp.]